MKRLFWAVFVILSLFTVNAFAEDVRVTERYMESTGFYRYYIDDDTYVESNVQLGGVVENIVRLRYNDYVTAVLYKDGKIQSYESGDYIYGTGNYTVVIKNDDKIGRISFILQTYSYDDLDLESSFYKEVSLNQSYVPSQGAYAQSINESYTFYTSVPDGALTTGGVKIYAPEQEGVYITAEKDGEEIRFASGKTFSDPGYYVISFVFDVEDDTDLIIEGITEEDLYNFSEADTDLARAEDLESTNLLETVAGVAYYRFTIIEGEQNKLNYIVPPLDYEIYKVYLNGIEAEAENKGCFKAEGQGSYRIVFKGKKDNLPDYSLNFIRDTVSPTISFEGMGDNGKAKNKVKIVKNDETAVIDITKNGFAYEPDDDVIKESGLYKITVEDEAGNMSVYLVNLTIPVKTNFVFIGLGLAAVILALYFYIKFCKNNIRIR